MANTYLIKTGTFYFVIYVYFATQYNEISHTGDRFVLIGISFVRSLKLILS